MTDHGAEEVGGRAKPRGLDRDGPLELFVQRLNGLAQRERMLSQAATLDCIGRGIIHVQGSTVNVKLQGSPDSLVGFSHWDLPVQIEQGDLSGLVDQTHEMDSSGGDG